MEAVFTFVTVVEQGSFSAAAAVLYKTPSAISHRIKSLEDALGIQLLERTTHSTAPTEAGKRLMAKAQYMLDLHQSLFDEFESIKLGVESSYTIVFNNLLYDAAAAARLLEHLRDRFRTTTFSVRQSVFMGVWDYLIYDRGSIAIGAPSFHSIHEDFVTTPLGADRLGARLRAGPPLPERGGRSGRIDRGGAADLPHRQRGGHLHPHAGAPVVAPERAGRVHRARPEDQDEVLRGGLGLRVSPPVACDGADTLRNAGGAAGHRGVPAALAHVPCAAEEPDGGHHPVRGAACRKRPRPCQALLGAPHRPIAPPPMPVEQPKGAKRTMEHAQPTKRKMLRVTLAGVFGTTLEFYDHFIYGSAAALVFPHVFFVQMSPSLALLLSLVTYSVAFVARPLGAVVFGHFGDRYGRKNVLIAALLMMGVSTFLIGCLPSYAIAGSFGATALVLPAAVPGHRAWRRMGRGGADRERVRPRQQGEGLAGKRCAGGVAGGAFAGERLVRAAHRLHAPGLPACRGMAHPVSGQRPARADRAVRPPRRRRVPRLP